jgi:orotate phosphoribosyltransferase
VSGAMADPASSAGDAEPRSGGAGAQSLADPRRRLLQALREHALVIGEVTLTSGRVAQYLVDAKRAILLRDGFLALGELVAARASDWGATAVGGMTMGADPIACAALAGGADVKAFFVRKETKAHGLARRIEGPLLSPSDRCLLVEDVVTTGGSTIRALEAIRDEGHIVCGVLAICDRLAGGDEAIRAAAGAGVPYEALTTIDDVYPERPDR